MLLLLPHKIAATRDSVARHRSNREAATAAALDILRELDAPALTGPFDEIRRSLEAVRMIRARIETEIAKPTGARDAGLYDEVLAVGSALLTRIEAASTATDAEILRLDRSFSGLITIKSLA